MTDVPLPPVLVAGIGNIFLSDDGFGVEVVRRLLADGVPGARVVDFGIRGFDLGLAIASGVKKVILVDATSRGGAPGTLYVLAPEDLDAEVVPEGHGMDPVKAIALARSFGALPTIRIVACEPESLDEEMGLSPAVDAAIGEAMRLVRAIIEGAHA